MRNSALLDGIIRALKQRKLMVASEAALVVHQKLAVGEGVPLKCSMVSLGKNTYRKMDGNGPKAPNKKNAVNSLGCLVLESLMMVSLFVCAL